MGREVSQFKEGNTGKPKGATNKTTRTVKEMFATVFSQLQEDESKDYHLKNWSIKNPTEFYKLSSKLLPIQIAGDAENPLVVSAIDGLTFEQLYQLKHGKKPDK
jgi:hypothetical protein